MTSLAERSQIITLVQEAMHAGARQDRASTVINLNARTLQRWQMDQSRGDQRPCRTQTPTNKLSVRERQHVLAVANTDEFDNLPPSQIVPILVDRGEYLASESTFYRILRAENLLRHRGR